MATQFKVESNVLLKNGNYQRRAWRGFVTNLHEAMQERERFLRNVYHFTSFEVYMNAAAQVIMNCSRPEGTYNGVHLRRMHAIYTFTPFEL